MIIVQDPKIEITHELNHGLETEEHKAITEGWKEHENNVIEKVTNHTNVQLVETKEKQRTHSIIATSVKNFILENVSSELTFVSIVDKKDIFPVNAEIQGRKIAQQWDNPEQMPESIA